VSDAQYAEIADEIHSSTVEKVRVAHGAGLYMKTPFIQTLKRFEARLLEYDEGPTDILMGDKYQLSIDSYARWRVRNPFRFLMRVQEEEWAQNRLRDIISSALRKELGRHNHYEIIRSTTRPIEFSSLLEDDFQTQQPTVHTGREVILERVTKTCDLAARQYGIQVTDVRVKRVDLPDENANSVYKRMMEERKRIATRYINEGSREAQKITSDTDRQVKIIKATAERTDLEIRGNADAEAARIYSEGFTERLADGTTRRIEGFGADPDFFRFTRKLQALKRAVGSGERLILSTDSPVLDLFNTQDTVVPASPSGP
jgi:membrane protease subunit HflC